MNKLIRFKQEETNSTAFTYARHLLLTEGRGIQDTVNALIRMGTSELYAKSVVVHIKVEFYS